MTDTVKCSVPRGRMMILLLGCHLCLPVAAHFLLIVEPSRVFSPPTDRLPFEEKNAELTKGARRIATAELKKRRANI